MNTTRKYELLINKDRYITSRTQHKTLILQHFVTGNRIN